jgi:hypothetical protein
MAHRKAPQPGLDDRYRDLDGTTHRKRRDTLVRTLRETYGPDFAKGTRSDATLGTVLDRAGAESLDDYLKNRTR